MTIEQTLMQRSEQSCELCKATNDLTVFDVPPADEPNSDKAVLLCPTCLAQVQDTSTLDIPHWRCLNDSMWSQVPAVQVMAWRQLKALTEQGETWAQDLIDMLYLDEETQAWAESGLPAEDVEPTKDSNGTQLQAGDTVTVIKDLEVKGAGFTAKRGTTVKNISLSDNPEHIEGRVNGTRIVLKTCFLKKL